jgi:hypothetical protein
MADNSSVDPAGWLAEQIGACEPDLLRSMVKSMAEALMSAEAPRITTSHTNRSWRRPGIRGSTSSRAPRTSQKPVAMSTSASQRPSGVLGIGSIELRAVWRAWVCPCLVRRPTSGPPT